MKKNIKNTVIIALAVIIILLTVLSIVLAVELNNREFDNMEIERKYLIDLNNLPDSVKTAEAFEMVQTYINYSPEIRVRKINNLYYFLTMKLPKDNVGLAREEVEYSITPEDYEELLKKQVGNTIYKTRYELFINNIKIEVDIYAETLTGLCVAEVEFQNIKKSEVFVPPEWFGPEITSDSRYKNASLARDGLPSP